MSIPGLERWLDSPPGRHVLGWESARIDGIVADIFGYNALQLGMPELDLLRENRIPFRQKVGGPGRIAGVDVHCDLRQLPFAANSIDLVVMPHVLEFYDDPHQILREVERILIPEGQIVLTGFNPYSLWGLRRRLPGSGGMFPWQGQYLSATRSKDWLQLLGFEVARPVFGCHVPPCRTQKWLHRWSWLESSGERGGPASGGVYLLRAIKRVHSMRLILPSWQKTGRRAKALAPITQKENPNHGQ
ncbi:MAG TPA: methyltransferase domain-containing protein [Azospira sp.]|jgi:SAM-dependent methyltransferase|nr:methyltransferase domain-containing protein [Azospira sp.]HNN07364.1 methyltransferase domain-containing protein [Azospira sp.]HNN45667.1 methyltransferase domain-containing protein [Azospira sp.]